jgi:hypothetical protein
MEQFVHYSVLVASNCCLLPLVWVGVVGPTDRDVRNLVLDLLVESAMEFRDDPESFHVAHLIYELLKVIDGALSLVISRGFEFGEGELGFILRAELSDKGFMERFPGRVFGGF